jgi:hypothetical protein
MGIARLLFRSALFPQNFELKRGVRLMKGLIFRELTCFTQMLRELEEHNNASMVFHEDIIRISSSTSQPFCKMQEVIVMMSDRYCVRIGKLRIKGFAGSGVPLHERHGLCVKTLSTWLAHSHLPSIHPPETREFVMSPKLAASIGR